MKESISLLRPLQWFKNVFVLAPLFFSNNMLNMELLLPTLAAFASFCLVSSSVYCFNDIHDAEADRRHPTKCKRPIASGALSVTTGYVMMVITFIASLVVMSLIVCENRFILLGIIIGYWLLNIAYCVKLKQYAIIDVFIIAAGYVLRVLAGGLVACIYVSDWLVLMTFLICLFLALTKRKDDYYLYEETGHMPRKSIAGYNAQFIDLSVSIVAAITMVCYILYTMSESVIERMGTSYLYLTSIWVLAGLMRYLQNMLVYHRTGSPTKVVMKDRFIQLCIIGWLASFIAIIYL